MAQSVSSGSGISSEPPITGWVQAIVVAGALLMAAGAAIAFFHRAMLVAPEDTINHAATVYAGYLVSRNLYLAVMLLLCMRLRAREVLPGLMLLTAFVQLLDALLDLLEKRWTIAPGVTVLGLLFLIGAARLSGCPFWKLETWKKA